MDTVTHVLIGTVITETGLIRKTGGWGKACGIICSSFPDIDMLLGFVFGTEFVVNYHRSLTNSLFLLIPFSLMFSFIFTRLSRLKREKEFFLISLIQLSVHIFLDLITSYGSMILWPVSNKRLFLDWLFIIDPYFSSIPFITIIAVFIFKKKKVFISRLSILICIIYIIFCSFNQEKALRICKFYAKKMHLNNYDIGAIPQPLSPFFWAIFIKTKDRIYEGYVDLMARDNSTVFDSGVLKWFTKRYRPPFRVRFKEWSRAQESKWIKRALELEGVKRFLLFARYPISNCKITDTGTYRVNFIDLRYLKVKGYRPFQYVVEFRKDGKILKQGYIKRRLRFFK